MKGMFEYKGYCGSISYSEVDNILYGKIEFIRDLLDYQGNSLDALKAAFEESVDDYLSTCSKLKKEPDKPFKGSFNVRIGEDLHRNAYLYAIEHNVNLNEVVVNALTEFVDKLPKNVHITNNYKIFEKESGVVARQAKEVDSISGLLKTYKI